MSAFKKHQLIKFKSKIINNKKIKKKGLKNISILSPKKIFELLKIHKLLFIYTNYTIQ